MVKSIKIKLMYTNTILQPAKRFTIGGLVVCMMLLIFSCKKENYVDYTTESKPLPPSISAVTDLNNRSLVLSSVVYGDWIIIKGQNLGTTFKVEFSNVVAADSLFSADDTTVTVKIPSNLPDPANNPIKVTTKYGTAIYNFQILQPAPVITSFTPGAGGAGTEVTLSGDYFLGVTSVKLNTTDLAIVSSTKNQVKVTIPSTITGGFFFVTTPSGTTKAAISYGLGYIIYDDALATGWSNTSYSTTATINNTASVLRGTNSVKTNYTVGFGGFRLTKATPTISTTGYTTVKFSVFGSTNSGGYKIRVILNGSSTATYTLTLPTTLGVWTQVEVPLSSLGNPATISSIELKEYSGKIFEVFFDDIGLF
jgi:hypothetical protein